MELEKLYLKYHQWSEQAIKMKAKIDKEMGKVSLYSVSAPNPLRQYINCTKYKHTVNFRFNSINPDEKFFIFSAGRIKVKFLSRMPEDSISVPDIYIGKDALNVMEGMISGKRISAFLEKRKRQKNIESQFK